MGGGGGEVRSADTELSPEQLRKVISDLYPKARDVDNLAGQPTTPPMGTLVEAIDFDADVIAEVIKCLPKGSAHGSSSWTYSWIQKLFGGNDSSIPQLHQVIGGFFQKMLGGKLEKDFWTCSRAVLIPKPEEGKWRPTGIGESWYRFFGRAFIFEVGKSEFGEKFTPFQYGVCVPGGCEYVARMAQISLDHKKSHVLLKTDFKNAFNLIPRQLILEGLRKMCPALIPFFLLGVWGRIEAGGHTGSNRG